MTNDKQRAVQPSLLLRTVVEPVPATRHQRHPCPSCHEHGGRILTALQTIAYIFQQREMREQLFNLSTPLVELLVDVTTITAFRLIHRIVALDDLLIRLSTNGVDGLQHRLRGLGQPRLTLLGCFAFIFCHVVCGIGKRTVHILIPFPDDLLNPGLTDEHLAGLSLVSVVHDIKVTREDDAAVVA